MFSYNTHKQKLNSGYDMPSIGFGTWQIKDRDVLIDSLKKAYEVGYRLIDTATVYENEQFIGEFLSNKNREEFFLTSKLPVEGYNNVEEFCRDSLKKLQTDYLDLYLIHWPLGFESKDHLIKIWKKMEELVEKKLVKSIGVSNFTEKQIQIIINNCKIKPSVNQIELHPYCQEKKVKEYCDKNSIVVISYTTLGRPEKKFNLREDPVVQKIANTKGVSLSQILLGYVLSIGCAVIPRSCTESHQRENFRPALLTEEEISKISQITEKHKYVIPYGWAPDAERREYVSLDDFYSGMKNYALN